MLTQPQLDALKADILATPALNAQPPGSDGNAFIAAYYNQPAVPDFWVWRTAVSKGELTNSVSPDGTTFNWTGTGFITRAVGERDAWRELFGETGFVNPSLANVRQAFADIFSGATAPAPANRTHLTAVSRRKATRFEKLFAVGTGSMGLPATMVLEGPLAAQDVDAARA